MALLPPRRPSFRWLTISLVMAAGVYAWYAFSQYSRLNDLNQRQLSNAGAELKTSLDNAAETVRQFYVKLNRFNGQLALNRVVGKPDVELEPERPRVCDFVNGQPYLFLQQCAGQDAASDIGWDSLTAVEWIVESTLEIGDPEIDRAQRFQYRTDRLLRELAFPDAFELIFVATDTGQVLYQDAPTGRRWLRHLRWGERAFRDAYTERPPTLQIHNVQQLVGGEAAWHALRAVSSRTAVELGGTTHHLYLQPLSLTGSRPINLIVGGAVPRSTVLRDALALGTPLLAMLVCLMLVALLGFPFVKLACLDMHERFGRRDIKLLYLSSGALLVLFTCGSLALDGYTRWRVVADRGLESLAAHLETRLLDEVRAIRDQLSRYDDDVAASKYSPCDRIVRTHWFRDRSQGELAWPLDTHLNTVSWIDTSGRQIWKTTGDTVPGLLYLGHRAYFRAVRDGNVFQIDGTGRPIFIAPDRSIADGKFYTFVSMRSALSGPCAQSGNGAGPAVVVTTAQLMSLDRQPLPAGYGFALINRDGRVLYHSDGRRSLRENLYEELSAANRARAMTYAGYGDGFDTRYRERPHRFHLHPVALSRAADGGGARTAGDEPARHDPAFYLAVFRDLSVEQGLIGHVFVSGLASPMVLCLLLAVSALGLLTLAAGRAHGWTIWLWPHRGLNGVYIRQVVVLALLLVTAVALSIRNQSLAPYLILPFLTFAAASAVYWRWLPQSCERATLTNPAWQTLSVVLFLACTVVVPSAALFRLALGQEFAKLILTEREWINAQAEDWLRETSVEALKDRYAEPRVADLQLSRARYLGCVPAPFSPPPAIYATETPAAQRPDAVPAALEAAPAKARLTPGSCGEGGASAPARATSVVQSMGIVAGLGDVLHEIDNLIPVENETLARQMFQRNGQSYSPDGTLVPSFRASGVALAGLALSFALLFWWIRWNTTNLFLADLEGSCATRPEPCEQLWQKRTRDEQMVLVQIARERFANPYQRPIVRQLLQDGLVRLAPDLQPSSEEFEKFLRGKEQKLEAQIKKWEENTGAWSWRYGRLILGASVIGVLFFLVATQPGLQSSVTAIATSIAGVLTAGSKLREAITSWFSKKS